MKMQTRKLPEPVSSDGVQYHSLGITFYPGTDTPAIVAIGKRGKNGPEEKLVISVNIPKKAYKLIGDDVLFFLKDWGETLTLVGVLHMTGVIELLEETADTGQRMVAIAKIA